MDWLEDELRRALAREDPPDGSRSACWPAASVGRRARAAGWLRRPWWWWRLAPRGPGASTRGTRLNRK